jgi:hypothetical protein
MKYEFIFLCLIILGSDYLGKKLNVMLKPLIEELKELWKGVETYCWGPYSSLKVL